MKIGIVGCGMIVSVIADLWRRKFPEISVTAIWGRPQERARAEEYAERFSIKRVYTDYDEFLADESFDVAYIGLVNSLHYAYSRRALLAGKNVVCEKPFTSTGDQARELLSLARERGTFVLESILPWYEDNYDELVRRLPEVGEVKLIQSTLSQYSRRYDAYRQGTVLPVFDPQLDGGALYDMAVYAVHWVMGLVGVPQAVSYFANRGSNGIDTSGVLVLDYGSFKAVCMTAKDSSSPSRCVIQGDKGYLFMDENCAHTQNVRLVRNGEEPVTIDVCPLGEEFEDIWCRVTRMAEEGDFSASYDFMERVIEVMDVMEMARKDAGIAFSCDES